VPAAAAAISTIVRFDFGVSGFARSIRGAAITSVGPAKTLVGPDGSGGPVTTWSASAAAKSEHVAKRAFGSLAIALVMAVSTPANSGCRALASGGCADRCWVITTAGLECSNGADPVSR
jgi:hypothetical protein